MLRYNIKLANGKYAIKVPEHSSYWYSDTNEDIETEFTAEEVKAYRDRSSGAKEISPIVKVSLIQAYYVADDLIKL